MYFVYVLYNKAASKIYIGETNNLDKRVKQHNDPNNFLSRFTKRFAGEWILIYKEEVESRSKALKREKQLKSSRGRAFIHALVAQWIERLSSEQEVRGSSPLGGTKLNGFSESVG